MLDRRGETKGRACTGTAVRALRKGEGDDSRGPLDVGLQKIRVAICDDHGLFRHGVSEMLSLTEDLEVVGEASIHEEAVAVVSELSPDVVLLDLEMPGRIGADESMRRMLDLPPPPSVVVFTMHDEPGMMGRFLARGAAAYFPKSAEMGELVEAVRHSDCARIGLTLEVVDGELHGLVEDDGEGFDVGAVAKATPSWGVGLRSMRERAEMLGGSLRVDSEPGSGTRMELRVPLNGRSP